MYHKKQMNSSYTASFSNCNAQVKIIVSTWLNEDNEIISEEEAKKTPVVVEWKNLNTNEEKTYRISVGLMTPSCGFLGSESRQITLSSSGRYIVMWYLYHGDGNLYMMVIDTETQQLTEGSSKEFGEFIDKSSSKRYHGYCWVRVLDNGLLHIVTVLECYENYLMDPKTNKVVLDIEKLMNEERLHHSCTYQLSIATPEILFLIDEGQSCNDNEYDYVFQYDINTGITCFSTITKQTTRDLAEKYTMFPYDLTKM